MNAVAYGSVMSSHIRGLLRDKAETRDEILAHTPFARIASPSEVADAVQYLASDGSGFVTGQVITVDGGRTLIDPAAVRRIDAATRREQWRNSAKIVCFQWGTGDCRKAVSAPCDGLK